MREGGVRPNLVTFNSVVNGLCKARRMEDARKVFDEMLREGFTPDEFSYNTLVGGYCIVVAQRVMTLILCTKLAHEVPPEATTILISLLGLLAEANKSNKSFGAPLYFSCTTLLCRLLHFSAVFDTAVNLQDRDSYWKMMNKYIGTDVTSLVTLPVIIFEPMTMLRKMAKLMKYCELLDKADECEDPYMRLVYASTWAVSVYFAYQRTWKPFNPILGETYEMVNHQGITFIAEQVSHHPPMGVAHAENEHFTYDITSKLKTKFLGNSVEVYPVGRAGRYEVDGYVYSAAEEPKIMMTGKWNQSMSCQPCDQEGDPLPGTELKEIWRVAPTPPNDKYQYTYFAHKINSFDTAPKKLLASDSRLRPDRYALEKGDMSKSGAEKSRLEEQQRAEKRTREAKGEQFTPVWFNMTNEISPTPWGDLEVYEYNGKYSEHRAAIDSSSVAAETDDSHTEFNPWQYSSSSSQ